MPTYAFICNECGEGRELVMGITQYDREKPQPYHCGKPMQRMIEAPGLLLVSEDAYTGLRAPDGTDISSRAKHRAYMREHNLTTIDDFRETWARQAQQRERELAGVDPTRADDIERAIHKLGG